MFMCLNIFLYLEMFLLDLFSEAKCWAKVYAFNFNSYYPVAFRLTGLVT